MPLISIITVSHNYGHYLAECLESVRAQEFRDFEHIVVDAASTDNTCALARLWSQTKLLQFPAFGLCAPKDFAISHAQGEYIVNLDADDKIHPQFLRKLAARAKPKTIVCPGLQEFEGGSNSGWPGGSLTLSDFLRGNRIFCCSMFPKADFFEVGGYDPMLDVWGYEDWELWIRLLKNGCHVEIVPEPLFYYRVAPGLHYNRNSVEKMKYDAERVAYIRTKHDVAWN